MKTEEIMKREAQARKKIIEKFTPEEKRYWEIFGELFADDPQKFLKVVHFQNGMMGHIIRQIQWHTLSEVEKFFTYYPKDCLDAWEVARLIQEDVRKKVLD